MKYNIEVTDITGNIHHIACDLFQNQGSYKFYKEVLSEDGNNINYELTHDVGAYSVISVDLNENYKDPYPELRAKLNALAKEKEEVKQKLAEKKANRRK